MSNKWSGISDYEWSLQASDVRSNDCHILGESMRAFVLFLTVTSNFCTGIRLKYSWLQFSW